MAGQGELVARMEWLLGEGDKKSGEMADLRTQPATRAFAQVPV